MWSPFLCDINWVTFYLLHFAALLSFPELESDQRAGLEVTIDWDELFRLSAPPASLPQDGDDPLQELHLRQVTAIRGISDVAPLQTDIRYIKVPGFHQFCQLTFGYFPDILCDNTLAEKGEEITEEKEFCHDGENVEQLYSALLGVDTVNAQFSPVIQCAMRSALSPVME